MKKGIYYIIKPIIFIIIAFNVVNVANGEIATIRGIYGMPDISTLDPIVLNQLIDQGKISAVFTPHNKQSIQAYRAKGLKVFLTITVFGGGKNQWKQYPDAQPYLANGKSLGHDGFSHGGMCPSNQNWRDNRLALIDSILTQFGDDIDGIWLDYIRYPGYWETLLPECPDTCYCPLCLSLFQKKFAINLPDTINQKDTAAWIQANVPKKWIQWKQYQIESFVSLVKERLNKHHRKLLLGLFIVPWTKGEKLNAISYYLGQNAFSLSNRADVISPMLYHRMCHKPLSWIGQMIQYYKETANCHVWPIIQAEACLPDEFKQASVIAGQSGADGLLVYTYAQMQPDFWRQLSHFKINQNMITNPEFITSASNSFPLSWLVHQTGQSNKNSQFFIKPYAQFESKQAINSSLYTCLGITGANDQSKGWYSPLPPCIPGNRYQFQCELYRNNRTNGVYAKIGLWGEEFSLNTNRLDNQFQRTSVLLTCPQSNNDPNFRFFNPHADQTFWMAKPELKQYHSFYSTSHTMNKTFFPHTFPIGAYGATLNNLSIIKASGFNTVFIGHSIATIQTCIETCHDLGLNYVISIPSKPNDLLVFLNAIKHWVRKDSLAFYIYDEPGIHSIPQNQLFDLYTLCKSVFPTVATCMTIVRPQACEIYQHMADYFMMDQYPIPSMPLVWLSDSMDTCASSIGQHRLASVIQAFGGADLKNTWPRAPSQKEMACLAFLSIIHDSQGLFFYTFSQIGSSQSLKKDVEDVLHQIHMIQSWLIVPNSDADGSTTMTSYYQLDPSGTPSVQWCLKKKDNQSLIISVNTINTYVTAKLNFSEFNTHANNGFKDIVTGESFSVVNNSMIAEYSPYQTRLFLSE